MIRFLPSGFRVRLFLLACSSLIPLPVLAAAYAAYDPQRLLTTTETPAGKKHGLDVAYLDRMLGALASHARNYPPQFDSPQDRQRAVQDVKVLAGMLDALLIGPTPHPELLLRAGLLNGMGHNLDIPGCADKAAAAFGRLLQADPAHARGNLYYGNFLAGSARPRQALPHLEMAAAAGLPEASYSLGMTWLSLGDRQKAIEHLTAYQQRSPSDTAVGRLIEGIRNGKVELKQAGR
ncbi:MAG: hypothetical protein KJ787_05990 [Gammaproteobacteria bacterium]|nr:hypothetical protein [Gammaproteobacteria bacterium]MBU1645864.1 hypothetical protein [Gammaproteobacteria bacterium]MBU1971926.1 hypothetical protein [Gammaproteobacteria bacterium]